eukprot:6814926-Prymnesium_polylepis.2
MHTCSEDGIACAHTVCSPCTVGCLHVPCIPDGLSVSLCRTTPSALRAGRRRLSPSTQAAAAAMPKKGKGKKAAPPTQEEIDMQELYIRTQHATATADELRKKALRERSRRSRA